MKTQTAKKTYNLSPSTIGVFRDCPRCFWLSKNEMISRPRGIYPSLPNGMDRIFKDYMDVHRRKMTMPPELEKISMDGLKLYPNQVNLNRWRNWRSGLSADLGNVTLIGAIDDLLVNKEGKYIPFDYKTKGKEATVDDTIKYYQHQTNIYAAMLSANKMPSAGIAVFLYWSPMLVQAGDLGGVSFVTQEIVIECSVEAGLELVHDAYDCLIAPEPEPAAECEYCKFESQRATR